MSSRLTSVVDGASACTGAAGGAVDVAAGVLGSSVVGVVAGVVVVSVEAPHGALAKRTPTVDSGSESRRTTAWRSVTCSIRPTSPPEVITGIPTAMPLRLPWLMVIVWSKLEGPPEMTSAFTRSMPDKVGRPSSDLSSWFSYTTASAAMAAPSWASMRSRSSSFSCLRSSKPVTPFQAFSIGVATMRATLRNGEVTVMNALRTPSTTRLPRWSKVSSTSAVMTSRMRRRRRPTEALATSV